VKHNPDRDVDWWAAWFGPETERQLRAMREHCDGLLMSSQDVGKK
jgi:hypothetical protein